jgi:hypothetical protein
MGAAWFDGGLKMRRLCFLALGLFVSLGFVAFSPQAESAGVHGDYVEVRSASVFAGACHYNGELTTSGRDALMAWHITSGEWNGVELTGTVVVAIVTADDNLSNESAARRAEIIIDRDASHAQAAAMLDLLKSKYASSLGKIVSVRSAPINFSHEGKSYAVSASDLASINVDALPNDLCCKMPNMVWYSPLVPLENRKVGYTRKALYSGNAAGDAWQRSGENSAFYGNFSL